MNNNFKYLTNIELNIKLNLKHVNESFQILNPTQITTQTLLYFLTFIETEIPHNQNNTTTTSVFFYW